MDYDLVVLGGGAAGLTAAALGASVGARTLLVERHRLGGDCTWTGCIPSKTLLASAHAAHGVRTAARFGIDAAPPRPDFAAVMARVRATRRRVYDDADRPERYEGFGATVVHGEARFVNPHALQLETPSCKTRVTFRYAVIATGGRPAVPPIPGLDGSGFFTHDTLFEITQQPRRLAMLGAGPVGAEMAQAFARLGTEVVVVDRSPRILGREDAGHAARLQRLLEAERVRFVLGATVARVEAEHGETVLHLDGGSGHSNEAVRADALVVATGRVPNVENLGLDVAGVEVTKTGIRVDERCRTSQRHVFAAGDCTGEYALTHMSEHMAKVAVTNALLKVPAKIARAHVSWVTFTAPELARVGAGEEELREAGTRFETFRFPYGKLDRAVCDDEGEGEIKVFATGFTGNVLGASVLGARAGELVAVYGLAMAHGLSLRQIADTIFAYPTYALGARRAADQWYARKQSPLAVRALQAVFGYRGPVPDPPDPERIV